MIAKISTRSEAPSGSNPEVVDIVEALNGRPPRGEPIYVLSGSGESTAAFAAALRAAEFTRGEARHASRIVCLPDAQPGRSFK